MTEVDPIAEVAVAPRPSGARVARASLDSLTGVRFFAAAAVVLFHFRSHVVALFPAARPWEPVAGVGDSGVDLFFILSGFIISYTYADRFRVWSARAYREFLMLRLARMYPVHLVILLGLGLAVVAARTVLGQGGVLSESDGGNFLQNLLLVSAWRGDDDYLSWNYPAWSISAEWFAYLLFPLVVAGTAWIRTSWQAVPAACVVLGVYLAATDAGSAGGALPRVVCEFVAGTLLAKAFTHMRDRRLWDVLATAAALTGLALALWAGGGAQTVALVHVFAALVLFLSRARGPFAAVLAWAPLVLLGEASYSLYMTHGVVDLVGQFALPMEDFAGSGLAVRTVVLLAYVVAIAGATAFMFVVVERPARRWLRNRLRRRGPVVRSASARVALAD